MTPEEARDVIRDRKRELGERLIILGHHYQADAIIEQSDYIGDSLELARKVAALDRAQYIVFCGVLFMAETAAILAPDKMVFIPDRGAGCPLADMAPVAAVEEAWKALSGLNRHILPVTYVNSSAHTKAFCGRNGGTVCTSGNARKVFEWALERGEALFFMPDKNLGRNTARALGLSDKEVVLWNPRGDVLPTAALQRARVIVWDGWCPVHWPAFSVEAIQKIRQKHPAIKVIVHPEADPQAVEASDTAGSTAQIIDFVRGCQLGEAVAVGTEFNMVHRLAQSYHSLVQVVPLAKVLCEDMGCITLEKLAGCLGQLDESHAVKVPEDISRDALTALMRMLEID